MKIKTEKTEILINEIDQMIDGIRAEESLRKDQIESVCDIYQKSARNLIHYNAFRQHDLRSVQKKLKNLGMSRLANSSGHVYASLLNTRFILYSLIGNTEKSVKAGLSIKNGRKFLAKHTKELLGYRSKGRRVRIMVTQPTQAAYDYQMVFDMVKNGMN